MFRKLSLTLVLLMAAGMLSGQTLHEFSAGSPISASKMNENFNRLKVINSQVNLLVPGPIIDLLEIEFTPKEIDKYQLVYTVSEDVNAIISTNEKNCEGNNTSTSIKIDDIPVSGNNPIIIPEGSKIYTKNYVIGVNCQINLLLVENTVEPFIENHTNGTYIVPKGKILILINAPGGGMRINNVSTNFDALPLVLFPHTEIWSGSVGGGLLTGYYINFSLNR